MPPSIIVTHAQAPLTIRAAEDSDWPAISLIGATGFGVWRPDETADVWRSMMPSDSAIVACDGTEVVGVALFLDLQLTVPGGAVLPMAGVSWVAVAPTHRRRGALSGMFAELHRRMGAYPIAGLEASEGGIYGRFGYGPATVWESWPSTAGRRDSTRYPIPAVSAGAARRTPQQLGRDLRAVAAADTRRVVHRRRRLWDESPTASSRGGGSALFCLLHSDGFVMYRVHSGETGGKDTVRVTKFAAATPEAHIALWRALLGLDLMEKVNIETHPGHLLPYLLTDARLVRTTGTEDGLWLRMLDIPAVLHARTYSADVSVVLDISDDVLGGGGRFALDVREGRARCVPTDAAADVNTDLSVLGSLYLGAHRASAFAAAHRLRADPAVVAALDAAFASEVPAELGYGF